MTAPYRIVANGKFFSIEKLIHRKFLWWAWDEWWKYARQYDRWTDASYYTWEKNPIRQVKEFKSEEEAKEFLADYQANENRGYHPV